MREPHVLGGVRGADEDVLAPPTRSSAHGMRRALSAPLFLFGRRFGAGRRDAVSCSLAGSGKRLEKSFRHEIVDFSPGSRPGYSADADILASRQIAFESIEEPIENLLLGSGDRCIAVWVLH